jgi:hypothetical protein
VEKLSEARVALAAFAAALFVYVSNGTLFPLNADTAPNAFLAASVLGDGDLSFGPFEAPFMFLWSAKARDGDASVGLNITNWNQVPPGATRSFAQHYNEGRIDFGGSKYYLVRTIRHHSATGEPLYVSTFGPIPGLTAVPVAALAAVAGMRLWENQAAVWGAAKLTASLLVAASAALIYLSAAAFVSRRRALLLAAAYAVGTCVWSLSSHSLWQQTPEILFLALGVCCLVRLRGPWLRGAAAGLAFSAAAATRPTAAIVAAIAAAWLLFSDRRALAAYLLAALPLAAATLAYNMYYFGAPLEFGQLAAGARVAEYKTGSPDVWQTPLWLGAAGLLASPSRGLLVYSPFLAAAFLGAALAWKDPRYRELRFLTLAVPALWLPAFLWFDWWGGWTYGYRPIVDSVPLLAVLCVPALDWILERRLWRAAFVLAIAWSVFVQALGAFVYAPWGWNQRTLQAGAAPADVDLPEHRHRLWSFSDWQIGYLIAHFRQARAERELVIAY